MTNSVIAQRLAPLPSSAFAAPLLMAARIAALLTPPTADMNTTLRSEVCISRVTSWMKDIEVTPSLYKPSRRRRRLGEDTLAKPARTTALRSAMPFHAARGACEQQERQHDQRGGQDREQKRPEKTQSAFDPAQSRKDAENEIDDGFEHGSPRLLLLSRNRGAQPRPDRFASACQDQELVA